MPVLLTIKERVHQPFYDTIDMWAMKVEERVRQGWRPCYDMLAYSVLRVHAQGVNYYRELYPDDPDDDPVDSPRVE